MLGIRCLWADLIQTGLLCAPTSGMTQCSMNVLCKNMAECLSPTTVFSGLEDVDVCTFLVMVQGNYDEKLIRGLDLCIRGSFFFLSVLL